MIPFMDIKAQHAPLREEILQAITEVVDSGIFTGDGPAEAFEQDFARFCDSPHAVAVGSGTEALWLTLLAMGIGPGDEVITVPMTFIATVEAIHMTGAKPVFVDIDERTYTMDPGALGAALTQRTKAIIPVHLFGQTAEMEPILEFASKHGLRVIEDAAQAHGALYQTRKAGSIGDAGCFSFYPAKNLGAIGEGGAIVTADAGLASTLRMLRNHGQSGKNHHALMGWNCRLDALQTAVLRVKLRHLAAGNETRRQHADLYSAGFEGFSEIITPETAHGCRHVFHIYAVRVRERQRVLETLARQGISCGIHYPVPAHLQPACAEMGHKVGDFPVSERCANEFLSLPMFPELTPEQIGCVVHATKQALAGCDVR